MSQLKTLELGTEAPEFNDLLGVDGKKYSLKDFDKPILAVIFSCNHCPYVQAYEERMISIARDYAPKGVQIVAINSNDAKTYPEDDYKYMVERAKNKGFNFPYLRDEEQSVATAYGAVCTPHVFVFDKERKLRYQGRIDDNRDAKSVSSHDLRNALDDLLTGREVRVPRTRPFGCSIKWFRM
ncbi:MAG: thioredoxin family protein [Thaumarchaeota archaeon]|nr:thioredoxin family protein [Nitrososphaerota archaeon]